MIDLLLPERCVHCEFPTDRSIHARVVPGLSKYLCPDCLRVLSHDAEPERGLILEQFKACAPGIRFAYASARYHFIADGPVQSVIHSFKYFDMPRLSFELGKTISPLLTDDHKVDFLIPVPLHRTRLAERGYNQAEALAKGIVQGRRFTVTKAIRRTRPTPTQTSLSLSDRMENVRGAFALTRKSSEIKGKHVVIIDDVMTTGSTIASAAEALLAAGPARISSLTLAVAGHPDF